MPALQCILLIDDSPAVRYLHASLINELSLAKELLIATDGKEGLELFEKKIKTGIQPDIVLLDLKMPVMDGFDFLETYKRKGYHQQYTTLLVVLTSSSDPRDLWQLQQIDIAQYIPKPLTIEDLQALTAIYLARSARKGL